MSGKPQLDPKAYVKLEKEDVQGELPASLLEDDDDGEERYDDVEEDGDKKPEKKKHAVGGWVFREKEKRVKRSGGYDMKHRSPAYARAEYAYYDELYALLRHFHPSVVKFATQIYEGTTISYAGNPLIDFSLPRFLERFSFKNPKKVEPMNLPHRRPYIVRGPKALAVMSRQYITMKEEDVPTDERFLHKYLQARFADRMRDDENREDDDDEVDDDEFDEIMRGLMPKGQMGAEDDSEEDDVDYAADVDKTIASQKGKKKAKRKDDDEEEEGAEELSSDEDQDDGSDFDELSDDDELSDEEDSKKPSKKRKTAEDEFGELSDEDAEVLEFDDDEDDELPPTKKKKTKDDGDFGPSSSVFASSEKFAKLIEATAAAGRSGGSEDIINKDNSHTKQLKWEQQRDFSSKKNWSHKKKFGKGPGTKKGSFNKPNKNFGEKKGGGWKKK